MTKAATQNKWTKTTLYRELCGTPLNEVVWLDFIDQTKTPTWPETQAFSVT
jgi:hypothetical protein